MTTDQSRILSPLSIVIDLLVNVVLIGLGFLIYFLYRYYLTYYFMGYITITPTVQTLVNIFVIVVCILPIVIGLLGIFRLIKRIVANRRSAK